MEVVNNRTTLLTNAEVFDLLSKAKYERDSLICSAHETQSIERRIQNHNTIVFECLKYLSLIPNASNPNIRKDIENFIHALKRFFLKTPS